MKKLTAGWPVLIVALCATVALLLVFLPRHPDPPGPYRIDVTRLPGLAGSLAVAFAVENQPVRTVTQDSANQVATALGTLIVTPPECLNMATADFGATVGTVVTSMSAHNPQYGVVITAAESPRPFLRSALIDACRTFDVERPDGAVSHTRVIDAPRVADATTSATHSIQTGGLAGDKVVDQYEYVAVLDARHLVTVTSFANPTEVAVGKQTQHLLSDAVNTVRWR
jgi:hypothetical protein